MYVDSRTIDDGITIDSEICIMGAGAAGITLAREFADQQFRVTLIESGGLEFDEKTDALKRAVNIGREYEVLPNSRLRFFGGTTNHWGGHCAPMTPLSFEVRPWIPKSGWPISRQDLDPYYMRAHKVIGLGAYDYDAQKMAAKLGLNLFPFDPSRVETVMSRYKSLRFGPHYQKELDETKNLTTYLWGNIVNINRHETNGYVTEVHARTLSGKSFRVRARYYILAMGGIENARMLLLSRNVEANGLGNAHDLVGRYFMDHIWYPSGQIIRAGKEKLLQFYNSTHSIGDIDVRGHIVLPDNLVRELQIPFFRSEIYTKESSFRNTDAGHSAIDIYRDVRKLQWPEDLGTHLVRILSGFEDIVDHLTGREEKFPEAYVLANYVEQVPNPDSRITLVSERDALGLNRAALFWQLSDLDKIGIQKAHQVIANEVGRSAFGRVRIELPEHEEILLKGATGGCHHMGTTRMHNDPHQGVVDSNCRIHGLKNFFIAGSSVFPNAGYINPTLTIVAMSIRLADHLKAQMNS